MFTKRFAFPACLVVFFTLLYSYVLPAAAQSGKQPIIYIMQGSTGKFANILIYLDGKFLRSLGRNDYLAVTVEPGAHTVSSAGTEPLALPIVARAGEEYYIRQEVDANGLPRLYLLSETEGRKILEQSNRAGEMMVAGIQGGSETKGQTTTTRSYPDTGDTYFNTDLKGYIGLGVGQAIVQGLKDDVTSVAQDLTIPGLNTSYNVNDTDTGVQVFGGYRFTDYFALEGVYADFGTFKANFTATNTAGTSGATADLSWKISGFGIAGVAMLPIADRFAFNAKLGFFHWTVENPSSFDTIPSSGADGGTDKESGTSPYFGVGATYAATETFGLRLEYERFSSVGKKDVTGEYDVDLISLSGLFYF